jgi:hypothetical protein
MSESVSWSLGPVESRLVRILLYLLFGLFVAPFVFFGVVLFAAGAPSRAETSVGELLLLLIAVLLAIALGRTILIFRSMARFEWKLREFLQVGQLRWFVAATIFDLFILWLIALWVQDMSIPLTSIWAVLVFLLIGFAHLLSSKGQFDPVTSTLSYHKQDEANLDHVVDMKRVIIGKRNFIWLSFGSDVTAPFKRLYMVPTDVAEQADSLVERETTTETGLGKSGSVSRRRNVVGALIVFGVASGLFILLTRSGVSTSVSILAAAIFATLGFILLSAAFHVS